MKYIYLFISFLILFAKCTLFAQIVNTPNLSAVEANDFSTLPSNHIMANTMPNIALWEYYADKFLKENSWTNDVTKIDAATSLYNCHSYAWYKSEGGTTNYWINAATKVDYNLYYNPEPKNIRRYWEDGSYLEVPENMGTKVWYGSCWAFDYNLYEWKDSCDHSAIKLPSGLYESKWGAWGRYLHPWDKSPYKTNNRKFYARTVSGPRQVCSVCPQATYTIGVQPGVTISWSRSPNLSEVSGQGTNSYTVASTGFGEGWVSATVNGIMVKKDVWSGNFPVPSISANVLPVFYPEGTFYDGRPCYYMTFPPDCEIIIQDMNIDQYTNLDQYAWYEWDNRDEGEFWDYGTGRVIFLHDGRIDATYRIRARTINNGGTPSAWSDHIWVWVVDGYHSYKMYPNPVSDILNIEIAPKDNSFEQELTDAKPLKVNTVYDIRLYDGQSNLLRNTQSKEGSKVEFNVSNLPDGIYYLHIYDGIRNTPTVRQIVVER